MNVKVTNFNYDNTFLFILLFFMYSMELSSITRISSPIFQTFSRKVVVLNLVRLHTNNPSGKDPISQPFKASFYKNLRCESRLYL
jgi:hypothetical protein